MAGWRTLSGLAGLKSRDRLRPTGGRRHRVGRDTHPLPRRHVRAVAVSSGPLQRTYTGGLWPSPPTAKAPPASRALTASWSSSAAGRRVAASWDAAFRRSEAHIELPPP